MGKTRTLETDGPGVGWALVVPAGIAEDQTEVQGLLRNQSLQKKWSRCCPVQDSGSFCKILAEVKTRADNFVFLLALSCRSIFILLFTPLYSPLNKAQF